MPSKRANSPKRGDWLVDSGATVHMTWDRGSFLTFQEDRDSILVANGDSIAVLGRGRIQLQSTTPGGTVSKLLVPDVLYVPELTINLLSLPVLDRRGISAHAANGQMVFKRGN